MCLVKQSKISCGLLYSGTWLACCSRREMRFCFWRSKGWKAKLRTENLLTVYKNLANVSENPSTVSKDLPPTHVWQATTYVIHQTRACLYCHWRCRCYIYTSSKCNKFIKISHRKCNREVKKHVIYATCKTSYEHFHIARYYYISPI